MTWIFSFSIDLLQTFILSSIESEIKIITIFYNLQNSKVLIK